jgi:hypothetical protein
MVMTGMGRFAHFERQEDPMFASGDFEHRRFDAALPSVSKPIHDGIARVARLRRVCLATPADVVVQQSAERIQVERIQR